MNTPLHIIVLAAGKGTRMHSKLPKALQPLGGVTLLEHVINTAKLLNPQQIHVVYGSGAELVLSRLGQLEVNWVLQKEQLGTGHAVQQVIPYLGEQKVLVLCCDVPLITVDTLQQLLNVVPQQGMAVLTAMVDDPTGFGRIVRNAAGDVVAIVEQKDASAKLQLIKEINSGIIATDAILLRHYLEKLTPQNAQKEYYLTDIVGMVARDAGKVVGVQVADNDEICGVNDKQQLAYLERRYQHKLAHNLMQQGVTFRDPARFDLRGALQVGRDVVIDVNVVIEGQVSIGEDCAIGANSYLCNAVLGKNVEIKPNCVIEGAVIGDDCVIGPFARIRPQTVISEQAHIGNFVEVKNSKIGVASKANHLSYVGDAIVGAKVNIGAGTITCNYDGANKWQTTIEDNVHIGSNTSLVAPVNIGAGATVGAGSVITQDVPAGKLALERSKQVVVEDWQRPQKKCNGES